MGSGGHARQSQVDTETWKKGALKGYNGPISEAEETGSPWNVSLAFGLALETTSLLAEAFAPLNFKGAQRVTPNLKTTIGEHVLTEPESIKSDYSTMRCYVIKIS